MEETKLHYTPCQLEIFQDQTRFKTVSKGRRFGFTRGVAQFGVQSMYRTNGLQVLWGDTVAGNIKRYIARYWVPAMKSSVPDGEWNWDKSNNIVHIRDSFCDFRSADRPENWEGYGYDLVILNEAGIILNKEYLWGNAVRPMLLDNPNSKAIIGGVPKGKNQFWDLCNQKSKNWKHFTFTSFNNPYLSKDDIEELITELKRIGGENFVKQEIFGEFLDSTEMQYIEGEIIDRAFERHYSHGEETGAAKVAGVDFARKRDRCAIVHRQGVKLHDILMFHPEGHQWSVRFARMIVNKTINDWGADHIFFDEGESGGGVIDILHSWGYGDMVTPVMFGSNANNNAFFTNKRVEMYTDTKKWLDERGSLTRESKYSNDLRRDLESLAYGYTERTGKLKLMPKALLSRSPDISDALALTFAELVIPNYDKGDKDPYETSNTTYVR